MTDSSVSFLTTTAVAAACGVTPRTVARWVDSGLLPGVFTSGGHRRIRALDLERFLSQRRSLKSTISSDTAFDVLVLSNDAHVFDEVSEVVQCGAVRATCVSADNLLGAGVILSRLERVLCIVDDGFAGVSARELGTLLDGAVAGQHMIFVGVTRAIEPGTRHTLINAGAFDVLAKPLRPSTFREILTRAEGLLGDTRESG